MKKILFRVIVLAIIAGGAYAGYKAIQQMPKSESVIATATVRQGDVVVRSYARGELRAVRSVTLNAPNLFGTVQVTKLAPLGAFAREKDLIVEFDDSELLARVEEKQLELDQIDEQIRKAQAEVSIRTNQDQVELLTARYAVRRAELEVKRAPLLATIDAEKNKLTFEESTRRLKQLESDIKSRQEQAQAELAVLRERRNKGNLEMARERARLQQVKILSPMSGLVAVRQNRGNFMMPGMQVPDIREGDQIQPGIPVADVLDLSEMEVIAKVGELDRANLKEGQEAELMLDALPENKLTAKIKSMSGTASANTFSFDPAKKFDVVFSIDMRQLLKSLGAKPDQISRILATAEQNRKKNISSFASSSFGGMGGGGGMAMMAGGMGGGGDMSGGMAGGAMGGSPAGLSGLGMRQGGGGDGGARGGQGGGGGRMFGGANLSPEDQAKMREAMQKALNGKSMQDLSQEERQQVFSKMRDLMREIQKKSGGAEGRPAGASAPGAETAAGGSGGERRSRRNGGEAAGGGSGTETAGAGGERRRGAGGNGGFGGMGFGGGSQYSDQEMANAKLPPPPEESSQFEVLLRPGLLADVQIIVEKIPNAIYLPKQAVLERDGKMIVFIKTQKGFESRPVQVAKQSETVVTISSGVKPGETVALGDPTAKPGENKKEKGSGGSGGAMGALPGGKS